MAVDDPSTKSSAYQAMEPKWRRIDDILAGADAIRRAGETYLPKYEDESAAEYKRRLSAAPWRPEFEDALRGLASRPFSKDVTLNEGVSEQVKSLAEDIDGQGNNLTQFAAAMFEAGIAKGYHAILVDYPSMAPGATLADERASGARPYWVSVPCNEILALYNEGKCAMWIDATIAASFITDPKQSKVANKVAFVQSPYSATQKGANWLWAWALAIPAGTKNAADAQKFITWATSKDYIRLVAKTKGWGHVPTGTRKSTYANPEFLKAAKFADAEKKAIDSANPNDSTLPKSPYVGVQFAAIPEFQAIGIAVGQQISAALSGKTSVAAALKASQQVADREMLRGGYYRR